MDKCKILIVENDESARKQLAKVVRKESFEAMIAEYGWTDGLGKAKGFEENREYSGNYGYSPFG